MAVRNISKFTTYRFKFKGIKKNVEVAVNWTVILFSLKPMFSQLLKIDFSSKNLKYQFQNKDMNLHQTVIDNMKNIMESEDYKKLEYSNEILEINVEFA